MRRFFNEVINLYEQSIAGYVESKVSNVKTELWADAFNSSGTVRSKFKLFLGTSSLEFQQLRTGDISSLLATVNIELQLEVQTLQNHSDALGSMFAIAVETLYGYRPYQEFTPLMPVRVGNVRRTNTAWQYGAEFTSQILIEHGIETKLTPILEVFVPRVIQIGLFNRDAIVESQFATIELLKEEII